MQLDNKDLMAVARSRVQRGKFIIWLMGIGLLWIVAMMVGLILCDQIASLLFWVLWSIVVFVIGMIVIMMYIEMKARRLFAQLKKEV